MGINLFRVIAIYLKPILPAFAERTEAFLGVPPMAWEDSATPLVGHRIGRFKPLIQRIDKKGRRAHGGSFEGGRTACRRGRIREVTR